MIQRRSFSLLRRLACVTAALGAFTVAMPASATVYTLGFDFTAPNSSSEKTTTGSIVFTSTNSNLTATVTAWNVTPKTVNNVTSYTLTQATLGWYEGGLGVISTANDNLTTGGQSCGVGSCNTHQIDNMGSTANSVSYDFLQISFSASGAAVPVTLGSLGLNAFGSYNAALNSNTLVLDDDFSYGKGNGSLANNTTLQTLTGLFQTNVGSNQAYGGSSNTSCQDTNGDGVCANNFALSSSGSATAATASQNWYLAASIGSNYGGDGIVDGFKLASANVYYVPGAVPEPGTWVMMLIGFGAIGMSMRRRAGETIAIFD